MDIEIFLGSLSIRQNLWNGSHHGIVVERRAVYAIFKACVSSKLTYGSAFSTTHRFISGHLQHPVSHITHQNLPVLKRACSAIYDISM